jgi:hypothetical protein
VVEVGVSESYKELKRDAWDWLWGSGELVKLVILIKLTKSSSQPHIDSSQSTSWAAFLELWERSAPGVSAVENSESGASVIIFRIQSLRLSGLSNSRIDDIRP